MSYQVKHSRREISRRKSPLSHVLYPMYTLTIFSNQTNGIKLEVKQSESNRQKLRLQFAKHNIPQ